MSATEPGRGARSRCGTHPDAVRLTVIVASGGRGTLQATIDSITGQLRHGDELLISIQSDCPWGHRARNQLQHAARGHALLFIDDDDTYLPGALDTVRRAVAADPERVHIFKMRYSDGHELWRDGNVVEGNVSTQMIVVPNRADRLGWWGERYAGDFDFLTSTLAKHPHDPVWHSDVIALYRPA